MLLYFLILSQEERSTGNLLLPNLCWKFSPTSKVYPAFLIKILNSFSWSLAANELLLMLLFIRIMILEWRIISPVSQVRIHSLSNCPDVVTELQVLELECRPAYPTVLGGYGYWCCCKSQNWGSCSSCIHSITFLYPDPQGSLVDWYRNKQAHISFRRL